MRSSTVLLLPRRLELQPQITFVRETKFRDINGVSVSASNGVDAFAFCYFPY